MLYICIFSNKLDLNQAIRVSHTFIVKNPSTLVKNPRTPTECGVSVTLENTSKE